MDTTDRPTEAVAPALTPEEWARDSDGPVMYAKGIDDMVNTVYEEESPVAYLSGRTLSILDGPVGPITYNDPASFHGLMALANAALPDGDPRKFTPTDVRVARDIAQNSGAWTDENRDALDRLAAKLAALLPPE